MQRWSTLTARAASGMTHRCLTDVPQTFKIDYSEFKCTSLTATAVELDAHRHGNSVDSQMINSRLQVEKGTSIYNHAVSCQSLTSGAQFCLMHTKRCPLCRCTTSEKMCLFKKLLEWNELDHHPQLYNECLKSVVKNSRQVSNSDIRNTHTSPVFIFILSLARLPVGFCTLAVVHWSRTLVHRCAVTGTHSIVKLFPSLLLWWS